jgi:predicted signal transduction protein with EAL and GGDEF domain
VRYLRGRGCDMAQGYYFSRPLPALQFASVLRRGRVPRLGPACIGPNRAVLPGLTS